MIWAGLDGELARLRAAAEEEHTELDNLRTAVGLVCEDLGVVQEQGTSSLATRVLGTYPRARELAREALHVGVKRAFGVFGSHYAGLNFQRLGEGYASGYTDAELDEIDGTVEEPAAALARQLEEEALPAERP